MKLFYSRLSSERFGDSYEAHHATLIFQAAEAWQRRRDMLAKGNLKVLPEPANSAANEVYRDTLFKLCQGLKKTIESYSDSSDAEKQKFYKYWIESNSPGEN